MRRRRKGKRARRRNTFSFFPKIPSAIHQVEKEYRDWIFEREMAVLGDFMETQPDLNVKMREIMFGWLVDIHLKWKCNEKTLFRALNIVDQWTSRNPLGRLRYQPLCMTALWIASKLEEILCIEIRDVVYICDRAYPKEEFYAMERKMVWVLDLTVPTIFDFAEPLFLMFSLTDDHISTVTRVLASVVMQYELYTTIPTSLLAAACVLLVVPDIPWNHTLQYYVGYPKKVISETVQRIVGSAVAFSKSTSPFLQPAHCYFPKKT